MTDTPFDELIALLASKSAFEHSIDAPFSPDGEWWLDLTFKAWRTSVAWKRGLGFGLFTSNEAVYGQRPDEVFADVVKAATRIRQIADHRLAAEDVTMTLKDVRLLLGQTQQVLADALKTGQAEISRLESRDDMHVDRFRSYIEALGGKLEVTVTFPDFSGPILLPSPMNAAARSERADRGRRVHA